MTYDTMMTPDPRVAALRGAARGSGITMMRGAKR